MEIFILFLVVIHCYIIYYIHEGCSKIELGTIRMFSNFNWWTRFVTGLSNRLSSTIDGNRKIYQLRTTSYVSNEKRKTTCPLINWYYFQDSVEINVVFVGIRKKYLQLKIKSGIFTVIWWLNFFSLYIYVN